MLTALILLAAMDAATTPAATPTPAPVVRADTGQTRTLADMARERKFGKKGVQGDTLSVAGAPAPTPAAPPFPTATEISKATVSGTTALAPAPSHDSQAGGTRTLADVARERRLGQKGVQGGTLSVAGAPVSQSSGGVAAKPTSAEIDKEAREADARLAKAITDGAWVDRNIHYNEQIRRDARREWDDAAENCRKTPGCVPVYRDSVELGGHKPLLTGDEAKKDRKFAKDSHEIETRLNNADAPNPTPTGK